MACQGIGSWSAPFHAARHASELPNEELLVAPANAFVNDFLLELDAAYGRTTADGSVELADLAAPKGAEAGRRVRIVRRGARIVAACVDERS